MEYLSTKEIALKLEVNEETVRRWIRDGKLKAEDLGKGVGYRVSATELEKFNYQNKGHSRGCPKQGINSRAGAIPIGTIQTGYQVDGVDAGGLVADIIDQWNKKGSIDNKNTDTINIRMKRYKLEKRKIEIEALINSLRAELSLIEHELKTAMEIMPEIAMLEINGD